MKKLKHQQAATLKPVRLRSLEMTIENVLNDIALATMRGEDTHELRADLEMLKAELNARCTIH